MTALISSSFPLSATPTHVQPNLDLAIAAWLDAKTNRSGSAKTARAYTDTIHGFRAALQAAGLDLDSDIQAIAFAAQGWAGQGDVAPATYNQRLGILSSFYAFAIKRGILVGNPIAMVDRRVVDMYANAKSLDVEDLRHNLARIDRSDLAGQRDYALLAIYLQTGRRLSEVAGLEWQDVRISSGKVTLHFRHCKGGKSMSDQLPKPVGLALSTWLHSYYGAKVASLDPETPIWVSLARNGRGRALSIRAIAQICEDRLGVSRVHSLRHTFAKAMEDSGAKVSDIQARLGHSSLATTGRYLAALKRAENDQADAIAALFGLDD